MLDALVAMKQAPQKDPMEEMTKMLSMMTMMRQAMGVDNQPRAGSSISEIVGAIRELRSAADEVSPPRDEPDSMMSMLPKVLDIVAASTGKGQPAQPEPQAFEPVQFPTSFAQAQPQPQPQPQPEPQPEPQPNPEPQSEDEMNFGKYLFKLRAYLSALVDMATKVIPVETTAQFVIDKLPDELLEIMELPNWFEQLAAVAPEVKAHEDYLRKVRDLALSMLDYEDDVEGDAKVGGTD
jgi:outer membrane biosynthesis protein TonB